MKRIKYLLDVTLSLFDGGAAGAGAAAPAQGDGGTQGETQASPAPTRRGKSGEYDKVLFGKQTPPATAEGTGVVTEPQAQPSDAGSGKKPGVEPMSDTLEDRRKRFRELVRGEFKDVYAEDTQHIIDKRFRETRALQEQVDRNQPIIEMLMQRYNIADGDPAKLLAAVENDDAYWSQAAEEAGMTVEQYKQLQKLQRDNTRLLQEQRALQGQQQAQQQLQKWYSEAEAVKAKYPAFDLNAEVKDPQFLAMLRAGIPVEHAYKVLHMDEIMSDVMATAAAQTEKQVTDNIRAKGTRPPENGTASQSAFTIKDDVSKLSKKDREEIARRVARGEVISF